MAKNTFAENRTIERKQGCWSCVSFDCTKAKDLWWNKARAATLARAVQISTTTLQGENDPRVKNIRRGVVQTDEAIERNFFGVCTGGGAETDFVAVTYLCRKWTGKQGASVAIAGEAPDMLPEELQARFDTDNLNVKLWPNGKKLN